MASSILLSDNGATSGISGIKQTGGDDGSLVLQTTTAGGAASTSLTATDSTVTVSTGNTERMRIDSAGNVGIGTSSPVNRLDVLGDVTVGGFYRNADVTAVGTAGMVLNLGARNGSALTPGAALGAQLDNPATTGGMQFYTRSGGALNERMRIDSSGALLVGATNNTFNSKQAILFAASGAETWGLSMRGLGGTTQGYIQFINSGGGGVGVITQNGGANVAYVTSSDYRLKHDIQPVTGALAKVAALKPCTYKWNADDSAGEGFIAHELQEVCPSAVVGEKDAVDAEGKPVYQGIDTSFLVATLTAAIQELKTELDEAKERIAALEAK